MMTTRLACNQAIESSYWRMDNDSDVGLLMGYVLYWLPVELEFMDLDTPLVGSVDSPCAFVACSFASVGFFGNNKSYTQTHRSLSLKQLKATIL
jgi:hypothetical protein